jgi:hypothetical protein
MRAWFSRVARYCYLARNSNKFCDFDVLEHVFYIFTFYLMKALAKQPEQRFATIEAFATALEQASQPVLIMSRRI